MKEHTWKPYAVWILVTEVVGGLSGWLTRKGADQYAKTVAQPPFSPPGIVFPIVWGILFALMGVSVARIYLAPDSEARTQSLKFFWVQLAFNFFWSIIFFNLQNFGLALLWLLILWGLIVRMMRAFAQVDRVAAWLQIPYLIWVTFAGYLNAGVWLLN